MLPVALGLGSATCVGIADFISGLSSRRITALQVGFWVQLIALGLVAVMMAVVRPPLDPPQLAWGLGAGVGSGTGLLMLYRGMAVGAMSLVAPIAACSVVVPAVYSIARGEAITPLTAGGMAAVLAGIVLASLQPAPVPGDPTDTGVAGDRQAVGYAIAAAIGFGAFFILLDLGSTGSGIGTLWTTSASRVSAFAVQAVLVLLGPRRVVHPGRLLPALAGVAVLDQCATILLGFGAVTDAYGVVTVLFGLYPVVTALLGTILLGERLTRLQGTGATLALLGVLLVSV